MLLSHSHIQPEGEIGIWQLDESEEWYRNNLSLYPAEQQMLSKIKGEKRRIEWLASRYLLHVMSGRKIRGACLKDEFGKPYLVDSSYHVSLSHSNELVAVLACPLVSGVDIQKIVPKISRIAHKFISEEEAAYIQADTHTDAIWYQHVIWGAKECLYKAYGRRELDFRAHLHIAPFVYESKGGFLQARISKPDASQKEFHVHYHLWHTDYLLVYAVVG